MHDRIEKGTGRKERKGRELEGKVRSIEIGLQKKRERRTRDDYEERNLQSVQTC